MPARAVLALLLAWGVAATAAQDPQRPPTFKAGAELVRVDVTVNDSRGRAVTNLTADDFTIEEDGVPQTIQSFKFVELTGQRVPGDDLSLTISSRQHGATEVARDDVRVFLIFWDEYHISPFVAADVMRLELVRFLRTMIGPTDVIALMDAWTPMSDLQFTRDHDELAFAVSKLQGRQGVFLPARNAAEENQMQHARSLPLARAQVAASALKSAMTHLGSLRQGRSSVIYVGTDFFLGGDSFMSTMELINAANDANVAFYNISPAGLQTRGGTRPGILRDLASNTGGEALRTNAPSVAFRQVVEQARASYLLGYAPTPQRMDGKFHKIKVKVKRPGIEIRARNGYWAPDVGAISRARTVAADGALAPEIDAVFSQLVHLDRRDADALGRDVRTIVLPDPPSALLSVGVPRLWRVQRPLDLAPVMSDAPPPPHDGREFTRTDRLVIRFGLAGDLRPDAKVSVGLIDRRGKRLTDLPFRADPGQQGAWLIDFPLNSIARGDYALAVEAVRGTERAAVYVPLRIGSS
ncbi:MAG TPA: VWA domain-containing protein [Vicinamibacterales bacterium]|nr:VWA domain-containing protein [Vicinamibacterales bacterium]